MTDREAIEKLKAMDAVTVSAELIGPAIGKNPGVLRRQARAGEYTTSLVSVDRNRIRFFRKDFLQKIGEIPEDPPARSEMQVLEEILTELRNLREAIKEEPR